MLFGRHHYPELVRYDQRGRYLFSVLKHDAGDFAGGPVVNSLSSSAGDAGLIPGSGTKMPHASWPKRNQEKKKNKKNRSNIVTNSIKTLKMVHIKNNLKKKRTLPTSLVYPVNIY